MFQELFSKFRKNTPKAIDNLEMEFDKMKKDYASIATSQLYNLFKNYFETKIEINRDAFEAVNLNDMEKVRALQCEIKVMKDFLSDIEEMRVTYENEVMNQVIEN